MASSVLRQKNGLPRTVVQAKMPLMPSTGGRSHAQNAGSYHASRGLSAAGVAGIVWLGLALVIWLALDWRLYVSWLIAGVPVTFGLFAFDKARAKSGSWRVPERALLAFTLLGGVGGAWLGMQWLRHKTRHRQFWFVLWVATVLHLAILGWIVLG